MESEAPAPRKEQTCPTCKASVDGLAVQCPKCDADLPMIGGYRRASRGRRYVYGKRKTHLSQEAVWLIVVIIVGLLIVFGVQVVAFMRSKKILMAPPQTPQAICSLQPASSHSLTIPLTVLGLRVRPTQPPPSRARSAALVAVRAPQLPLPPRLYERRTVST